MSLVRWTAIISALLALASPGGAQDIPNLFDAAGPSAMAPQGAARGVMRHRTARLNLRALERAVAPRGADHAQGRAERAARLEARVRLEAFPGAASTFRRKAVEEAAGGGFVWLGDDEGGAGAATLVVTGDQITGHVELRGKTFRIEPQSGTLHRILEIDIEALPPDAPHQHAPVPASATTTTEPTSSATPSISASTGTPTTISLLVGYTSRANNAPSNIGAEISLGVSLANQAFSNSGVLIQLKLAGTMLVTGYDEARYTYDATLFNLTGVSGGGSTRAGRRAFAPLRSKRDQLRADLVTLIREGGDYCGQGWVVENPARTDAPWGFTQVSRDCIPGYTLAHELGHNMGLNHDRYVELVEPASVYNYGYVNVSKRVRDIMSYPNLCRQYGVICDVQNLFSNPRLDVGGMPFGIFQNTAGAADGARRLNETRGGVASFR